MISISQKKLKILPAFGNVIIPKVKSQSSLNDWTLAPGYYFINLNIKVKINDVRDDYTYKVSVCSFSLIDFAHILVIISLK